MARCHAVNKNGDQCTNHEVPGLDMCQTHGAMKVPPPMIGPISYSDAVPDRTTTLHKEMSVNAGQRRLIGKARRKHDSYPLGAATLADTYGGSDSWWSRTIVYAITTPKYIHSDNVEKLKTYLADKSTDPPAEPPIPMIELEATPPGKFVRTDGVEVPDTHLKDLVTASELKAEGVDALTLAQWEESRRQEIAKLPEPELAPPSPTEEHQEEEEQEGPTLHQLHTLWLKSKEPQEETVNMSMVHLQEEFNLMYQRIVALETMTAEILTHLTPSEG